MLPSALWLASAISALLFLHCKGEKTPFEEGSSWIIGTFYARNVQNNVWISLIKQDERYRICKCDVDGTCHNFMSSKFELIVETIKEEENTNFVLELKIDKVNRTENKFEIVIDGIITSRKVYDIYVKPQKPECQQPVLIASGHHISVTCATEQVYPEANCVFDSSTYPSSLAALTVTYRNTESSIRRNDIATECNILIPVFGLSPGHQQFSVITYPDVSQGMQLASVTSELTPIIELRLPTAAIAKDCPRGSHVKDGYIMQGSTATCLCELIEDGYPVGYAQWYNDKGQAVGTTNKDGSSTLRLLHDPADSNPIFKCQAESVLNQSDRKSFITFAPAYVEFFLDDKADNSDSTGHMFKGVGIGLSLGFTLAIAVAVVWYFVRGRRTTATSSSTTPTASSSTTIPNNLQRQGELTSHDSPAANLGSSNDIDSGVCAPARFPRVNSSNSLGSEYIDVLNYQSDFDMSYVSARMNNRESSAVDNDYIDPVSVIYQE